MRTRGRFLSVLSGLLIIWFRTWALSCEDTQASTFYQYTGGVYFKKPLMVSFSSWNVNKYTRSFFQYTVHTSTPQPRIENEAVNTQWLQTSFHFFICLAYPWRKLILIGFKLFFVNMSKSTFTYLINEFCETSHFY